MELGRDSDTGGQVCLCWRTFRILLFLSTVCFLLICSYINTSEFVFPRFVVELAVLTNIL